MQLARSRSRSKQLQPASNVNWKLLDVPQYKLPFVPFWFLISGRGEAAVATIATKLQSVQKNLPTF